MKLLCTLVLLAAAALPAPAVAQGASPRQGPRGVVPRQGPAAASPFAALPGQAAPPSNTALDPGLQLTYHGGPVMHTHTIHAIFWAPP